MKTALQGQVQQVEPRPPHAMREPSPPRRDASRDLRRRKWLELRSAVDGLVALGLSRQVGRGVVAVGRQEKERFAALLERAVRGGAPSRQTSRAVSRASSPVTERSRSPSG